jgi:hypothetical protein
MLFSLVLGSRYPHRRQPYNAIALRLLASAIHALVLAAIVNPLLLRYYAATEWGRSHPAFDGEMNRGAILSEQSHSSCLHGYSGDGGDGAERRSRYTDCSTVGCIYRPRRRCGRKWGIGPKKRRHRSHWLLLAAICWRLCCQRLGSPEILKELESRMVHGGQNV